MNEKQIKENIENLNDSNLVTLLISYGHELTIQARDGYEFQGVGLTNPELLRDCNEIQHRVFQSLNEINSGMEKRFSLSGLSHWIIAAGKSSTIQQASIQAFNRALNKCNK
jgi:hypothetical protein